MDSLPKVTKGVCLIDLINHRLSYSLRERERCREAYLWCEKVVEKAGIRLKELHVEAVKKNGEEDQESRGSPSQNEAR